jgi:hypothetical protein
VTGRLGVLPPSYPLTINATDVDTGNQQTTTVQLADERDVGMPTGVSPLGLVGSAAVAQAAYNILHGSPVRESGDMCVSIAARELATPMHFCNTYVGAGAGSGGADSPALAGASLVADFGSAASDVDSFVLGPLHITSVNVDLKLRRALQEAFLASGTAPHRVRRGTDVTVHVRLARIGGGRISRAFKVHVPRGMPFGPRELVLTGTPSDAAGGGLSALASLLGIGSGGTGDDGGPRSISALAREISAIHRYDGVTASFRPPQSSGAPTDAPTNADALPAGPEGVALRERPVYRDPVLRISGTLRMHVNVKR